MNKNKKITVSVTVVLILVIVGVVGYYAYLSGRSRTLTEEASMTAVETVLSRNMEYDYPSTPKEVLKYYNEIQKCFYNENCTEEEIEALANRARELYDAELLENNELGTYLTRLKAEIKDYKDKKKTITSVAVAASTNVERFEQDGYEFARIYCGYNVREGSSNEQIREVFLLRKDENKRWKIYGWEAADKVNPQ